RLALARALGGVDHRLEGGGDAEEEKQQQKPRFAAKSRIQPVADPDADRHAEPHLETDRGKLRCPPKGGTFTAIVRTSLLQAARLITRGNAVVKTGWRAIGRGPSGFPRGPQPGGRGRR